MLLRARESFIADRRLIQAGQLVLATDPVVTAARRSLFEPVAEVEQATAAPGERRTVHVPRARK